MFARSSRSTMGFSIIAALSLAAGACAPAAPSPTAAPAKPAPTAAPAKPAAQPTEKPAVQPTEKPAAKSVEKAAPSPAARSVEKPVAKSAANPADTMVPKPSGNLSFKMGHSAEKQLVYLPELMTVERLNSKGWNIEEVFFSASELNTEATVNGQVQMSLAVSNSSMLAYQNGQQLPLLAEWTLNDWVVVAEKELKQCSDLNGKRVAYHSEGAVSTAMLKQWVQTECPGTNPEYLVIAGSNNRANAIMNGQIDATPLFVADWVKIEEARPGEFPILRAFAEGLPNLAPNTYGGHAPWLQQNKPVATAFFAELLKTNRMIIADPKMAEDAAKRHFPELDANTASAIIREYNRINGFPPNGGLTRQKVEGSIKFFEEAGVIQPGLTADQISDLSILEGALEIVGRVEGKP